ncbi:MAG TPA: MATE family efflux transporter [Ferruginibacter sp.]|jgi:putative MATE family efflux protein|nr:MATE family efflux transporter [Ferruginibacter sp.]
MATFIKKIDSFFTLFIQAIKGDVKDFTKGSIDKAIFLLAVPMILEMVLESLFAVVDIYFVNKVGIEASSTVILTEASLSILYSVAWGLSIGVTALVARRAGEKNFTAASDIAVQAILLGTCLSLLISIIGFIFPKEILMLMGATPAVAAENYLFTQIMLTGNIVIVLLFVNNAIFRGAGNASIAMWVLLVANAINIVLDPLLIMGVGPFPKLGVVGAAVATTTGRAIAVLVQFYFLFNGKSLIRIAVRQLKFNFKLIGNILKTSSGGMFQFIIGSCSWIFLAMIIAESGTAAVSGYGTAIRICIFTILPAWGLANAAATLVGQNLGAGHPERAERSVWRTAFLTFCFFAVVAVIFFVFGENLMRFFIQDKTAVAEGTKCLHILAIGYVFFAYGMIISQAFNGAGDTRTPTYINLFVFWLLQIPLAYFMSKYLEMGTAGVYIAIGVAETVLAIVGIIIFRKGNWKMVKV